MVAVTGSVSGQQPHHSRNPEELHSRQPTEQPQRRLFLPPHRHDAHDLPSPASNLTLDGALL